MADHAMLRPHEIAHVCAAYGLSVREVSRLTGGTVNTHLLVDAGDAGHFVLTVLDAREVAAFSRLVGVMRWLASAGYPTGAPLDGDGKAPRGRAVIVRPYIHGTCHDTLPATLLPAAGAVLARLHGLGLPPRELRLPENARGLPETAVAMIEAFPDREFAAWMLRNVADPPLSGARGCITHGDLFSDNLVETDDGSLRVLDWETASVDDPLLDLGMAVVGLGIEDGVFRTGRIAAVVDGYRAVRPLSPGELHRLRELSVYAGSIVAFNRYVRRDDPRARPFGTTVTAVDGLRDAWPVAYGQRPMVGPRR
ncbi:phosphotransferase [Yinghuangia sp. YIM S09857]|uniref:phosphotransferase n=1 Tax=Yinghuangia sp. YIM S09857 TaxID=3436929 RepID=UPI003F52CB64